MDLTLQKDTFFKAIQTADMSKLNEMLELHPQLANTEDNDGLTPLGYAGHLGHREVVELLLHYGADVNAMSHSKISFIPSNTALHASIAGARNMDVIRMLLAHGARADLWDSNGHTCLHTAAFHDDNVEIIQLLIEHGADVNARVQGRFDAGETALAIALTKGNNKVVNHLRQHGAQ